jgi:hypothetical protein
VVVMNVQRDALVREIADLLGQLLVEVQAASNDMHAGRIRIEASFLGRWDNTVVDGVRVWKRHFDEGDWRAVVEAVAQLKRQMDYYPATDFPNEKRIDELVSALTLKAYDLCDMR